jgi:cytochrome o ubiquinol oxidase operon protein cyoD
MRQVSVPTVGSAKAYVIGLGLSLAFTLEAYWLTTHHLLSRTHLMLALAGLALAQAVTQLLFFLHLDAENRPRLKLLAFASMLVVVIILVAGSIWIMSNLNYHMTPGQVEHYLHSQDGL